MCRIHVTNHRSGLIMSCTVVRAICNNNNCKNSRDLLGFLVLKTVDTQAMVFLDVMSHSLVDGLIGMKTSFWSHRSIDTSTFIP